MQNNKELREKALRLVMSVWKCINWDNISPSRRMRIYDELTSKIKSAALTSSLSSMAARLQEKWGVRCVKDDSILDIIDGDDSGKVLNVLREETQIIVLMLRVAIEKEREKKSEGSRRLLDRRMSKPPDKVLGKMFTKDEDIPL
jgi:hypothetical protein